jgi:hypothetical protein
MGCQLGGNFTVGCALRGGRGEYTQKDFWSKITKKKKIPTSFWLGIEREQTELK